MNEKQLVPFSMVALPSSDVIDLCAHAQNDLDQILEKSIRHQIDIIKSSWWYRGTKYLFGKGPTNVELHSLRTSAERKVPSECTDAIKNLRSRVALLREASAQTEQMHLSLEDFQILKLTESVYQIKFDELVEKHRLEDREDHYRRSHQCCHNCKG